jgi:adenylate kinase family enzyme
MRRVLVMGCSGSGKSTFAQALAANLGLPLVSLDALFWQPGWVEPDKGAFTVRVNEAVAGEAWVIDGNYLSHGGEERLARADTICWFDLPTATCLWGVLRRTFASYGRVRAEMAPGCPERFDAAFYRYVWTYRRIQRPRMIAWLDGLRAGQRLVTFASRAEARAFLAAVPAAGRG